MELSNRIENLEGGNIRNSNTNRNSRLNNNGGKRKCPKHCRRKSVKSCKSRKSRKSRKSCKSRKSRKSRKSHKSRNSRKSRKSRKSRM